MRFAVESTASTWRAKLAFTALACICLTGCEMFGGRGGQSGSSLPSLFPKHAELSVHSECKRPVQLCWGTKEHCVSIAAGERRELHAKIGESGLPVRLHDADASVSADLTFPLVEIDESCTHLARLMAETSPPDP